MSERPDATVNAWRRAGEAGDRRGAVACLADDVRAISPLTGQFTFEGVSQVSDMLDAAFTVIDEISFHTEVGSGDTRALFYYGRCGQTQFEEAQLLRLNPEGLIDELTLFGRPLPGLTAVMAAIGPELLRKSDRPTAARLIAVATKPLALVTSIADRKMVPLARPGRAVPRQPARRRLRTKQGRT